MEGKNLKREEETDRPAAKRPRNDDDDDDADGEEDAPRTVWIQEDSIFSALRKHAQGYKKTPKTAETVDAMRLRWQPLRAAIVKELQETASFLSSEFGDDDCFHEEEYYQIDRIDVVVDVFEEEDDCRTARCISKVHAGCVNDIIFSLFDSDVIPHDGNYESLKNLRAAFQQDPAFFETAVSEGWVEKFERKYKLEDS